jgi:protein arginine N-methyltransferase 1
MTAVVEEHARYLADGVRVHAYRRALSRAIRPGDVVVDLGSGTGILGLLACEAGAARVYCIDESEMLEVARAIADESGYRDRITFCAGHSTAVRLPELADLVVCDQAASLGVGAGLLESFFDARHRFLKPSGKLMPERVELWLGGVDEGSLQQQVAEIQSAAGGIEMARFVERVRSDPRCLRVKSDQVRTAPRRVAALELGVEDPDQLTATVELPCESSGQVHGLSGWFSARLFDEIELTNSPLATSPIDRDPVFIPFAGPCQVERGDVLRVFFAVRPRQGFFAWNVKCLHGSGGETQVAQQTSLASTLIGKTHLHGTAAGARPTLSTKGIVRRTILELCDGSRTFDDIVDELRARQVCVLGTRERSVELVAAVLKGLVE